MKIKRIIEIEETNCKLLESRNLTLDTTTMLKASKRDIESSVAVLDLIYALKESKPYDDSGDLISRKALTNTLLEEMTNSGLAFEEILLIIDNAPTVHPRDNYDLGYVQGLEDGKPKGEREFIEILAQDVPDDLCTYPEYRGKPYYSIHYKENGEEFVGFGTYKPEVLSRYLSEYFMRGGAE